MVREPAPEQVHHQAPIRKRGFLISMNGRGNCYDTAIAGIFFKSVKSELVWRDAWQTSAKAEEPSPDTRRAL
ncbi:MAG: hypothetical protein COB97_02315 [Paracoccus sp.]|nr:MAG: hypothetical protein COB97_02315 [Paracoccus sp. (in: a-proteobacteria)]